MLAIGSCRFWLFLGERRTILQLWQGHPWCLPPVRLCTFSSFSLVTMRRANTYFLRKLREYCITIPSPWPPLATRMSPCKGGIPPPESKASTYLAVSFHQLRDSQKACKFTSWTASQRKRASEDRAASAETSSPGWLTDRIKKNTLCPGAQDSKRSPRQVLQ